jgi:hypothetical protein
MFKMISIRSRTLLTPPYNVCNHSEFTWWNCGNFVTNIFFQFFNSVWICLVDKTSAQIATTWSRQQSEFLLLSIHNGEIDPNLIFFSDEAWFYLNGEVNTQNSRYWSDSNPRIIHEFPLHDSKIGVWCGLRQDKIVGPIFFEDTINFQRYILSILRPFFELLNEHDRRFAFL